MLLHRFVFALLIGISLGLGFRVVDYSLKGSTFYAIYASRRAPGEQLDTGAGFLIEGFTMGLLPAGSDKEAVTNATLNAADAYDQAANQNALAIGVTLVLATLWAALQRFFDSTNMRAHLVGVLVAISSVCLSIGIIAPIITVIGYGDVPLVGTSIVSYSSKSILSAADQLLRSGKAWVGWMILVFSIATPLAKLVLTLAAAQAESERTRQFAIKIVNGIGKWSMADVFVVALLLATFSLSSEDKNDASTNAEVGLGLYFFASHCAISIITGMLLQQTNRLITTSVGRKRGFARSMIRWIFLIGGMATAALLSAWFLRAQYRVARSFLVHVGTMHTCAVFADRGPGIVSCSWVSSGKQHRGSDDTIVRATLLGPSGEIIRYWDHESSGTVSESVSEAGVYSIVFSNKGIVRSTDRTVRVELGYVPK